MRLFERGRVPTEEKRVFDGVPIVPPPASNRQKPTGGVERTRRGIRLANLEKQGDHPRRRPSGDRVVEQSSADPPPTGTRRRRDIRDLGLVSSVSRARLDGLVKPFTLIPERGLKDYAALYSMDEPTTEILLRNAATIVERQTAHELKDAKPSGK